LNAEERYKSCFVNFVSVDEPDRYFSNFEIIHKEKRIIDKKTDGKRIVQAYIKRILRITSIKPFSRK